MHMPPNGNNFCSCAFMSKGVSFCSNAQRPKPLQPQSHYLR